MNMTLELYGTPGERQTVVQAGIRQLEELMYAMTELGTMTVKITVNANLYTSSATLNPAQAAPGEPAR